jgi:hypothetical protein
VIHHQRQMVVALPPLERRPPKGFVFAARWCYTVPHPCFISSVDRALDYGSRCRAFESLMKRVKMREDSRQLSCGARAYRNGQPHLHTLSYHRWEKLRPHLYQTSLSSSVEERRVHTAGVHGSIPCSGTVVFAVVGRPRTVNPGRRVQLSYITPSQMWTTDRPASCNLVASAPRFDP